MVELARVYVTLVALYLELPELGTSTIIDPLEGSPCAAENVTSAMSSATSAEQVAVRTWAPLLMVEMATAGDGVLERLMPTAVLFATVSVPVRPPAPALFRETARLSTIEVTFLVTSAVSGVTERESRASEVASMSVLAVLKGVAESRLGLVE